MMHPLSHFKTILVVSDEPSFQTLVTVRLKEVDQKSHSFLSCPLSSAFEYADIEHPSLVLIDLTHYEDGHLGAIRKIAAHFPNSKLIGVGNLKDADSVIQLIKLGVKDFLKLPFDTVEVQTLLNDSDSAPYSLGARKAGRIVTVFSPKGGTGVTLLTVNLGTSLAQNGLERVAILDLAPQAGDVTTYLDLTATYTLRDLIDNVPRLDPSFLEGVSLSHPSGLKILASPRENQEPLHSGCSIELQSVFSLCRQTHDVLLIDAAHTDETLLQLALTHSDLIVLVGNSDVPSLKGLLFALNKLTKLNYDPSKIKVVINRFDSKNQLDTKEFEKKTKQLIACRLPNQYFLCIEAINAGLPIAQVQKNSNLVRKISELAQILRESVVTHGNEQAGASPRGQRMSSAITAATKSKWFT